LGLGSGESVCAAVSEWGSQQGESIGEYATQVASSKRVLGLIRSELEPEETRGLTRSGDLSRMLPSEAHLMASGWPVRLPASFSPCLKCVSRLLPWQPSVCPQPKR